MPAKTLLGNYVFFVTVVKAPPVLSTSARRKRGRMMMAEQARENDIGLMKRISLARNSVRLLKRPCLLRREG